MNIAYKMIVAGMAAFWMSCSNDSSGDQSIAGATTEPSTSPIAELTEEQKAVLARSFYILVDSAVVDSLKELFGSDVALINYNYFNTRPWSIKNDQVFSFPSKDGRKVCDVVPYTQENRREQKGVLQAMSYDVYSHECAYIANQEERCPADDYLSTHRKETIVDTKVIDVDGASVVMQTVGYGSHDSFWGYDVTCGERLKEFKQSCSALNGLFLDLGDGCNMNQLSLACASFIPEGETPDEVVDSYAEAYKNQCLEDSIKYAPYDDENYVYHDPYSDSLYRDSLYRVNHLIEDWYEAQTLRSMAAYRWQFSIIDSTVGVDNYYNFIYEDREDDDLALKHPNSLGLAYNILPNTKNADAYRKEGVYVLPDSLVAEFFPRLATFPTGLEGLKDYPPEIFYLIVIKDIGAKGHLVTDFDANGIYVTDIVKSGNCPEDTTVHYSMILLVDSPDWDVLVRPIVKTTYVSDNWNCDKPETLEKKEPYGEWTIPTLEYDYEGWFAKVETDKYLEMFGGKDRYIELFGEENYLERIGKE